MIRYLVSLGQMRTQGKQAMSEHVAKVMHRGRDQTAFFFEDWAMLLDSRRRFQEQDDVVKDLYEIFQILLSHSDRKVSSSI